MRCRCVVAVTTSLATIACSGRPPDENGLASTAGLRISATIDAAEIGRRRDAIRAYFKTRVDSLKAVTTTRTSYGTVTDWIKPTWSAPTLPPPSFHCTSCGIRTDLMDEPSAQGPAGTVPVVRFDVERYLANTPIPPADPRDVMRKAPPPSPENIGGSGFYHVGWDQTGTFFGGVGQFNVWASTPGPLSEAHSLVEMNLHTGSPGSGLGESVEVGVMQSFDAPFFGGEPVLFTYYTTNDWGPTGDNVGGYDDAQAGWMQLSATIAPGAPITSLSTFGGTQVELGLALAHDVPDGLYCIDASGPLGGSGEWIGCYPDSLFSAAGIANTATNLDFYGEVSDPSTTSAIGVGMGSGHLADEVGHYDYHVAYIMNMGEFTDGNGDGQYFLPSDGSLLVTDPNCYTADPPTIPVYSAPDDGVFNYFFYGGPGTGKGPSGEAAPNCR